MLDPVEANRSRQMKAADWIDRVKSERGWESDYRVAKELGLGRATVSKYRNKATTLDDDTAIKVAGALGEKPEIILLDQAQERTRSEDVRQALQRVLTRLGVRGPKGGRGSGGAAAPADGGSEGGSPALNVTPVTSTRRAPGRSGPRNSWCPNYGRYIHRIKSYHQDRCRVREASFSQMTRFGPCGIAPAERSRSRELSRASPCHHLPCGFVCLMAAAISSAASVRFAR
jgi:transcriptional regulator with XRE-family HTH domain